MKTFLKIKCMSLAAEARIIRLEEKKWPGVSTMRSTLHQHRVLELRKEARSACLAYGFLRKRRYRQLEAKCYTKPDWKRVQALVEKYGTSYFGSLMELKQQFKVWIDERESVEWSKPQV